MVQNHKKREKYICGPQCVQIIYVEKTVILASVKIGRIIAQDFSCPERRRTQPCCRKARTTTKQDRKKTSKKLSIMTLASIN